MDRRRWPTEKPCTSWLPVAPGHQRSGGTVVRSTTRRSAHRAAPLVRWSAVHVGRTHTALGACDRRWAARVGKAQAVTATARKRAVLFYHTLRHGMAYEDPGGADDEERYRQRVLKGLRSRAKEFGYERTEVCVAEGVS